MTDRTAADLEGLLASAYTLLDQRQDRIDNALEMLHQPEYLWSCPCCTATRAALTGQVTE